MADERRSVSLCAATHAFLDELGDVGCLGFERAHSAVRHDALYRSPQLSEVKSSDDDYEHVGAAPIEPIPFAIGSTVNSAHSDECDARMRWDIDATLDALHTTFHTVRPHTKGSGEKFHSQPLTMDAITLKWKHKEKMSTSRRQKDELSYLRAKVTQLERELRELHSEKRQREVKPPPPVQAEPQKSTALAQRCMTSLNRKMIWKLAAQRQLKEKRRAELENVQLKQQLEEQTQFTKTIERMLRKQPAWYVSLRFVLAAEWRRLAKQEALISYRKSMLHHYHKRLRWWLRQSTMLDDGSKLFTSMDDWFHVQSDEIAKVFTTCDTRTKCPDCHILDEALCYWYLRFMQRPRWLETCRLSLYLWTAFVLFAFGAQAHARTRLATRKNRMTSAVVVQRCLMLKA